MSKKKHTPYQFKEGDEKLIIAKLERYCAYTERCEADVYSRLRTWEVPEEYWEDAMDYLKEHRYIHQERYGQLYTHGKFKLKGWGRQKIRAKLREKQVDEHIIESSMSEIEEAEYEQKLGQLLSKKLQTMKKEDDYIMKGKLYQYAYRKGYEAHLIMKWIDANF